LATCFAAAHGDIIVMMDGDLQYDPADIPKLIRALCEGVDLAVGWRTHREDRWHVVLLSRIYNWATSRLTGMTLHDCNCGLKVCLRVVTQNVALYGELHRYFPVLVRDAGYVVREFPISHLPRRYGRSRYGWGRLHQGFWDLIDVTLLRRFRYRPLHLFGTSGVLLMAVSAAVALAPLAIPSVVDWRLALEIAALGLVAGLQLVAVGSACTVMLHVRRRSRTRRSGTRKPC
jgi:glycosyltransferase involved in cell wall biosynthesis